MSKKYHHDYQRVISFIKDDNSLKHVCLNYAYVKNLDMSKYSEIGLVYIESSKKYYRDTLILRLMYSVDLFYIFNYSVEYYLKSMDDYFRHILKKETIGLCDPLSGGVVNYVHKDDGYCQVELELIGSDNILGIEKYIISGALHGCSDKTIKYALSEMDNGISAQLAYEKAMDIEINGSSRLEKMVDDLLDSI